jgi:hypothetical protein
MEFSTVLVLNLKVEGCAYLCFLVYFVFNFLQFLHMARQ